MTALGLPEEHKRFDRDLYIKINLQNAQPSLVNSGAFAKYSVEGLQRFRLPYDLFSVRHADQRFGSRDESIVMDWDEFRWITFFRKDADGISTVDAVLIQKAYGDSPSCKI